MQLWVVIWMCSSGFLGVNICINAADNGHLECYSGLDLRTLHVLGMLGYSMVPLRMVIWMYRSGLV